MRRAPFLTALLAATSLALSCAGAPDATGGSTRTPQPEPPSPETSPPATSGGQLTLGDLASRLILYVTPVHGDPDVDFCSLRREITANRNTEILTGAASASRGWAEWCMKERAAIDSWFGSDPDAISRVRIWIRQPVGDHNMLSEGDMPADTIRHHLDAHPESRLYEGMADAYHRHLLAPPTRPALARAWFYAGSPDNDAQSSRPAPNFAGLSATEILAQYQRDYIGPLNMGATPLIAPGSIARIAIDKATPHGVDSGTYLLAQTYPEDLLYEPLGVRGNPWAANPAWTGLILEDTFWDRLGPDSRSAQPSEVQGPIARFINRAMNFTPREKWHRFCAMLQRRAYTADASGGKMVSDEGDQQVYFPVIHIPYLQSANDGLLKGYNDWRASRSLPAVPKDAFDTAEGLLRAVNEFDGPYTEQEERAGPARRDRVPAGREDE